MMKKVLKLAGFGFLLGIVINDVISILSGDTMSVSASFLELIGDIRTARIIEFVLVGLYGAICMGGVVLYDTERLPLALATVLHCLICIVPFCPLAFFLGWCKRIEELLIIMAFQLAAFFIVWLIMYLRYRIETKKLNEMQQQVLEEENKEE